VASETPSEDDVALVLAAYEAWTRGDIDAAVAALHPDVEWTEPDEFPGGGTRRGPAAVAGYLRNSRQTWTDLHSAREAAIVGGEVVVVHHVWGTAADGTSRDVTVADVYTVRDGQVLRMHAHADPDAPFRR